MKIVICFIILFSLSPISFAQKIKQTFVSTDIENFWSAYDQIILTKDSIKQYSLLKDLYLDKGTDGLKKIVQVRNYSAMEFITAINEYPKFWKSLRKNSLNTKYLYAEIDSNINKLKNVYPSLRASTIYFLIGAFRTNGTISENNVLIGSELSLGDETTVISEFPDYRQKYFNDFKPKKNIALLCTHEYIHTQQKQPVDNLLSYCIYEGVAEFISCLATGKKSNTPSIEFGKKNQEKVISKFMSDIYSYNFYNWLWGENSNELKERDLGYYIGYEICERYYNLSVNKEKAIKELIELDYTNDKEVERIVDTTKIFSVSLQEMWEEYEKKRPTVISVSPIMKDEKINPGIIQLSITFSQEMDVNYRGFDYGPLGENYMYKFNKIVGWTNNNRTFTIEVEVGPNRKIQAYLTSEFSDKNGIRLKPFLLEFETAD